MKTLDGKIEVLEKDVNLFEKVAKEKVIKDTYDEIDKIEKHGRKIS